MRYWQTDEDILRDKLISKATTLINRMTVIKENNSGFSAELLDEYAFLCIQTLKEMDSIEIDLKMIQNVGI